MSGLGVGQGLQGLFLLISALNLAVQCRAEVLYDVCLQSHRGLITRSDEEEAGGYLLHGGNESHVA